MPPTMGGADDDAEEHHGGIEGSGRPPGANAHDVNFPKELRDGLHRLAMTQLHAQEQLITKFLKAAPSRIDAEAKRPGHDLDKTKLATNRQPRLPDGYDEDLNDWAAHDLRPQATMSGQSFGQQGSSSPSSQHSGRFFNGRTKMIDEKVKDTDLSFDWLAQETRSSGGDVKLENSNSFNTVGHLSQSHKTDLKNAQLSNQNYFVRQVMLFIDWLNNIREPPRTGRLAYLVQSSRFDIFCVSVILANAVLILVSTNMAISWHRQEHDENVYVQRTRNKTPGLDAHAYAPPVWATSMELIFMTWYVLELLLKLVVHRAYFFCSTDAGWNLLDFVLVVISVIDAGAQAIAEASGSSNMTFLRLLRLLKVSKVFRMFRALQFVRELRLMLDCLVGCVTQLFWNVVLLGILLGLFAVFFVQGFTIFLDSNPMDNSEKEVNDKDLIMATYGSVQKTMLTLFMCTSGGDDWVKFYQLTQRLGHLYMGAFIFFIVFFMLAVWNVVTSLFMDRAMKLAQPEAEQLMLDRERDNEKDGEELMQLCHELGIDSDGDGGLSWKEFQDSMANDKFRLYFDIRGINIRDTKMFFRMLSAANPIDGNVDLTTFVNGCMRLKGVASSIDLQTLSFEVKLMHGQLKYLVEAIDSSREELLHCYEQAMSEIKAAGGDPAHLASSTREPAPAVRHENAPSAAADGGAILEQILEMQTRQETRTEKLLEAVLGMMNAGTAKFDARAVQGEPVIPDVNVHQGQKPIQEKIPSDACRRPLSRLHEDKTDHPERVRFETKSAQFEKSAARASDTDKPVNLHDFMSDVDSLVNIRPLAHA